MYVYLIFLLLSFILHKIFFNNLQNSDLAIINGKSRCIYTILACFLLILIIGLKHVSVGTDTYGYFMDYRNNELTDWNELNEAGSEHGYLSLINLCTNLGLSWIGYSIVVAVIIIVPMGLFFYKYSTNLWASYALYMTIGLFAMNMTGIRQSESCSLVLLGTYFLFDDTKTIIKRYVLFALFVYAGYLFHYSALIAIIIGIVPLIKYRSTAQLTFLLFIPVATRLGASLIFSMLGLYMPSRYEVYDSYATMNPILEAMWVCILLFSYYTLIKSKSVSSDDFRLYLLIVFYVAAIETSFEIYMASRLSFYFESAIMVAIPCFINKYSKKSQNYLSFVIYMLCIIAFIISLNGSDTLTISKYRFFWE